MEEIKGYVEKRILSGDMLEIDIFPSIKKGMPGIKLAGTSEVQQKLNARNRKRKLCQLLNANFTKNDVWITVGYRGKKAPTSFEEISRDCENYLRRIRRAGKKVGIELKALKVIEFDPCTRAHIHIVCNFRDRDKLESLWNKGEYPQTRKLEPNDFGLTGLACYLAKDPKGKKTYGYTKNLLKSWKKAKYNFSRYLSRRKFVEKLALKEINVKAHFEKIHKDYEFVAIESVLGDYGGIYCYVTMKKKL